MALFVLFVSLLGAAILLLYAASSLPPASLAKIVRYVGGGLLAALAMLLVLTGRIGLGFPAAVAAFALFRGNLGRLGAFARNIPGMGRPSSGQTSDIQTPWLEMWLDHDTGQMGGRVRQGRFSGADLGHLSLGDLLQLRSELIGDGESLRLLDSFIERVHGADVGANGGEGEGERRHHEGSPRSNATGMSREEALEVLGLEAGASVEDIKLAHRDLMQKVHPDRGGSSYLATKLNQAKDLLLASSKV
ncbi:MAG: molecular chaperone DnaJ [Candidatus Phaeomarinobacter sp.]